MRFECTLNPAGWGDVASLMDPFCEAEDVNGYQWLNEQGKCHYCYLPMAGGELRRLQIARCASS
jgi:hypothetical protein